MITTYDVLFMADHFVLVTTVNMQSADDKRDIEKVALKRLADEYGDDFAAIVKSAKQVTIEEVRNIPAPGDMADTGEEPTDE